MACSKQSTMHHDDKLLRGERQSFALGPDATEDNDV